MADVKLPGVGPVSRKWLGIVAVGSVVTVGYVLMRRKSKAAATTATDSAGTTDPATGDIAGSAQDQADLASLQTGGYGDSMYGGGSALGNYGGYLAASPAGAAIPGSGGFATNGEWAQQAEADLANPPGLSNALGQYLTGRPLSPSDQGLTDQAIAEEGYPPVAGPSGYPPAMHSTPTSTTPPGPASGTVTGVRATNVGTTSVTVAWNAAEGAQSYSLAGGGQTLNNIAGTSATLTGLKAHTRYTINVAAKPATKGHGSVTVTTKK